MAASQMDFRRQKPSRLLQTARLSTSSSQEWSTSPRSLPHQDSDRLQLSHLEPTFETHDIFVLPHYAAPVPGQMKHYNRIQLDSLTPYDFEILNSILYIAHRHQRVMDHALSNTSYCSRRPTLQPLYLWYAYLTVLRDRQLLQQEDECLYSRVLRAMILDEDEPDWFRRLAIIRHCVEKRASVFAHVYRLFRHLLQTSWSTWRLRIRSRRTFRRSLLGQNSLSSSMSLSESRSLIQYPNASPLKDPYHRHLLLQRFFLHWKQRLVSGRHSRHNRIRAYMRAVAFWQRRTLQSRIHEWHSWARAMQSLSEKTRNYFLMKCMFSVWKQRSHLALIGTFSWMLKQRQYMSNLLTRQRKVSSWHQVAERFLVPFVIRRFFRLWRTQFRIVQWQRQADRFYLTHSLRFFIYWRQSTFQSCQVKLFIQSKALRHWRWRTYRRLSFRLQERIAFQYGSQRLLKVTLLHWRQIRKSQIACKWRNKNLLQVFYVWHVKYERAATLTEWGQLRIEEKYMRLMLVVFNQWKQRFNQQQILSHQASSSYQLCLLDGFFHYWQQVHERRYSFYSVALLWHTKSILQRTLDHWRHQFREKRNNHRLSLLVSFLTRQQHFLLKRYFQHWQQWRAKKHWMAAAESLHGEWKLRLYGKQILSIWHEKWMQQSLKLHWAHEWHQKRRLKLVFISWQFASIRQQLLQPILIEVKKTKELLLLQQTFNIWKTIKDICFERSRLAKERHDRNVKKYSLSVWKKSLKQSCLKKNEIKYLENKAKSLISNCFSRWRLVERLVTFQRQKKSRLFSSWRQIYLQKLSSFAALQWQQTLLLRRAFLRWNQSFKCVKACKKLVVLLHRLGTDTTPSLHSLLSIHAVGELLDQVDEISWKWHQKYQKKNYFRSWRQSTFENRQRLIQSTSFHQKQLFSRAIVAFHQTFLYWEREQRVAKTFQLEMLQVTSFVYWRNATKQWQKCAQFLLKNSFVSGISAKKQMNLKIMKNYLHSWRRSLQRRSLSNQSKLMDFHWIPIRIYFDKWRNKHRSMVYQRMNTLQFYEQKLLFQVFDYWKILIQVTRETQYQAKLLQVKNSMSSAYHQWRSRCSYVVELKETAESFQRWIVQRKMFHVWQKTLKWHYSMTLHSVKWQSKRSIHRCFTHWRLHQRKRISGKQYYFSQWREFTLEQQNLRRLSEDQFHQKLYQQCMTQWVQRLQMNMTRILQSVVFVRLSLLRHAFSCWQQKILYRKNQLIQSKNLHSFRLLQFSFVHWRQLSFYFLAAHRRASDLIDKRRLFVRFLSIWSRQLENKRNMYLIAYKHYSCVLLRFRLAQWTKRVFLRWRLKRFQILLTRQFLREILFSWRFHCIAEKWERFFSHRRLAHALELDFSSSNSPIQCCFDKWRYVCLLFMEMGLFSVRSHEKRILKRYWIIWKQNQRRAKNAKKQEIYFNQKDQKLLQIKRYLALLQMQSIRFYIRPFFRQWRLQFQWRRSHSVATAVPSTLMKKKEILLQEAWQRWRTQFRAVQFEFRRKWVFAKAFAQKMRQRRAFRAWCHFCVQENPLSSLARVLDRQHQHRLFSASYFGKTLNQSKRAAQSLLLPETSQRTRLPSSEAPPFRQNWTLGANALSLTEL